MIDIDEKHLITIKTILKQFVPKSSVWIFGSRVTHSAKSYSDLDLVIIGESRISQIIYYQIKDAMEESNLPFRVDVLDWHRISASFQKIIQKKHIVLM